MNHATTTMSARWRRVQEVFHAAVELPASDREQFLQTQAGDDTLLMDELQRLLRGHQSIDESFLEPPATAHGSLTPRHDDDRWVGRRIGRYTITALIGVGGMGAVYEATQDNPRRTVALKLLRSASAGRNALRRFEHEADLLARLRHPGIAQIHEAGLEVVDGQTVAFFVMELIPHARSILDYARDHALALEQRVELMARVCEAVHHGHQRGVIHRDLKPGNILVDADGHPKVIDFGVARATEDNMTATLMTEPGLLVGTLQYMSPEQISEDDRDVDIRSDVYALGMLAFELFDGRPPYDVSGSSIVRAARMIRDTPPRRLGVSQPALKGDLETIVHKAIEKDRSRRYESAAAFAADMRRYLGRQPIEARPATTMYQLHMFARRNRGVVAGLAVALAGLVLGTAGAVWQAVSATRSEHRAVEEAQRAVASEKAAIDEARRSQQIATGLVRVLESLDISKAGFLKEISPLAGSSGPALDGWLVVLEQQFRGDPETLARVLDQVGRVHKGEGAMDRARALFERAADIRREAFGEDDARFADSLEALGDLAVREERFKESIGLRIRALDLRRRTQGELDTQTIDSMINLRGAYCAAGDYETAERIAIDIERIVRANPVVSVPWEVVSARGQIARELGRLDDAASLLREGLKLAAQRPGREDPNYGGVLYHLAVVAVRKNDPALLKEVRDHAGELEQLAAVLPEDHPHHTGVLLLRGVLEMAGGDLPEAERLLRDCEQQRAARWGRNQKLTAYTRNVLGECLVRQGRLDEAEPMLIETAEVIRRAYGPHHVWSIEAEARLEQCREVRDAAPEVPTSASS